MREGSRDGNERYMALCGRRVEINGTNTTPRTKFYQAQSEGPLLTDYWSMPSHPDGRQRGF